MKGKILTVILTSAADAHFFNNFQTSCLIKRQQIGKSHIDHRKSELKPRSLGYNLLRSVAYNPLKRTKNLPNATKFRRHPPYCQRR